MKTITTMLMFGLHACLTYTMLSYIAIYVALLSLDKTILTFSKYLLAIIIIALQYNRISEELEMVS